MNTFMPHEIFHFSTGSSSSHGLALGGDDEFIPYEATSTSKYGPISRGVKVKGKNTGPVQVTADQVREIAAQDIIIIVMVISKSKA